MLRQRIISLTLFVNLFFLLFGFQIGGINTRYLSLALMLFLFGIFPKYLKELKLFLLNKFVLYNLIQCMVICILPYFISTLHFTSDYSLAKETYGIFIIYISVLVWVFWFTKFYHKEKNILEFLLWSIFLQSIIIIACFLNPSFYNIIKVFQFSNITEVTEKFLTSGIARGFALAGDQFFGLSSLFGLMYFFLTRYVLKYSTSFFILTLPVIFISNFFVGRTSFVAIPFCILIIFLTKVNYSKIRFLYYLLLGIVAVIMAYFLFIPKEIQNFISESVLPYAFELFYNFANEDSLSTDSTDDLMTMLSVDVSPSTFLFGDGFFTSLSGYYYKGTDSGYFRLLLYGGITYVLLYLYAGYALMFKYSNSSRDKYLNLFLWVLFVFLMVLQIKGMAFYFSREIMVLLFIYMTYLNCINSKDIITYD